MENQMSEPNFFRQPGWKRDKDILSMLWSLSQVCQTQAATPEHCMTPWEVTEAQQFQAATARAIRALADKVELVAIAQSHGSLVAAHERFREIVDSVSAPDVQGEPVSGYG